MNREQFGLYRDDGLAAIRGTSGRKFDKLRKDIIQLFQEEGLRITIESNLTVYLDVTLDLLKNKYYPFRKPENKPLYINAKSNHPQNIIKELPKMISRRVADLSCNEEEFLKAKPMYESALKESGHTTEFSYVKSNEKKKRNRRVVWFNQPFSKDEHWWFIYTFGWKTFREHKFYKIFNKHTIRLGYSCMPNMAQIIKQSNMGRLADPDTHATPPCNCENPQNCPLPDECLTKNSVYEATVTAENADHIYFGTSKGPTKTQIEDHQSSLQKKYENKTELSKFVWSLQDKGIPYSISWRIASRRQPYRCGTRRCDLCLTEKTLIARSTHPNRSNDQK